MPVAKKASAAKKAAPRRTAQSNASGSSPSPAAYSEVDLRVWAVNTAVNVFGGVEGMTASKLITQAKRFANYAATGSSAAADDEG